LSNSLKGCDNSQDSDNTNWLSKSPGYPTQNPTRHIYYISSYRSFPGGFIVLTKDNQSCYLPNKSDALKKFSEQYPDSQPPLICHVNNLSATIGKCGRIEDLVQD
ncbi:hypothetical protein, partial [Nostoc sp. CHAB 5715]|uniref:hypothetical protein n=1 Tax=Nostoc sp. CHAB 5715 TaxID=2780400 RepID=UPI001E5F437C